MGLLNRIKDDVKKSGQNKGKFAFFREGQKARIRFLTDMDDGLEITFHDSYAQNINVPCQEIFDRDCPYCENSELRTRSQYVWNVFDYDSNEVKLFMFPVNNCSPIPPLISIYENYGTLTDRDYVVTVQGKQQNKSYTVVPMDKAKFRNNKVKPFSEKAILKMIDKAYPCEDVYDFEEEENEKEAKRKRAEKEENPFEDWENEDDEGNENNYAEMTAKELFNLCKERGIDVQPKKPQRYYINELEDWDAQQNDWGDDEDDEDWEA